MNIDSLKKDNSINSILNRINKLESQIYPVGSIYISVNNTNPETIFGGKWLPITDKFLVGVGSNFLKDETGGDYNHTHKFRINQQKSKCVLSEARALNYNTKSPDSSTVTTRNFALNTNSALNSGTAWNYNDGEVLMSEGTTSLDSNLPPYLSVYMWKRIS